MKQFSRSVVVLMIAMFALGAVSLAGPNDSAVQNRIVNLSMKNFHYSLKSDIPGVVEGTIADVVIFKKLYPNLDFDGIKDRLNELAETSTVPVISYKAHLASIYLSHPAQFQVVPKDEPEGQNDVFRQITNQLEKTLLSSNLARTTASAR